MSARDRTLRLVAAATVGATLLLAACQATPPRAASEEARAKPAAEARGLTDSSMPITFFAAGDERSAEWKTYGPVRQALEKVVGKRNAAGGIAHRKVEPLWALDAQRGADRDGDAELEAVCAAGVGERHSFAIQPTDHGGDLGRLERAGCVGSGRSITFVPDRVVNTVEFDKMTDVVAPYALEDVTAANVLVHRLTAQGFFEGDPTVAILDPGGEFDATVRTVMASELLVTAGILEPLIVTDDAKTKPQIESLVRKLRSEGVERVVYFDDSPNLIAITRAMVAQKFTPPLAMIASAQSNPVVSSSKYPARQVYAISSVGAYPVPGDATPASASLPDTKAVKACLTAWDGSAVDVDGQRIPMVLEACDMLALLDSAFAADDAEPSTASFADGLAKLTHFESAYGVTLDFSHGHAGAAEVWELRGDPTCHCLEAVGGPYPLADE